jgi:hypothetical protein
MTQGRRQYGQRFRRPGFFRTLKRSQVAAIHAKRRALEGRLGGLTSRWQGIGELGEEREGAAASTKFVGRYGRGGRGRPVRMGTAMDLIRRRLSRDISETGMKIANLKQLETQHERAQARRTALGAVSVAAGLGLAAGLGTRGGRALLGRAALRARFPRGVLDRAAGRVERKVRKGVVEGAQRIHDEKLYPWAVGKLRRGFDRVFWGEGAEQAPGLVAEKRVKAFRRLTGLTTEDVVPSPEIAYRPSLLERAERKAYNRAYAFLHPGRGARFGHTRRQLGKYMSEDERGFGAVELTSARARKAYEESVGRQVGSSRSGRLLERRSYAGKTVLVRKPPPGVRSRGLTNTASEALDDGDSRTLSDFERQVGGAIGRFARKLAPVRRSARSRTGSRTPEYMKRLAASYDPRIHGQVAAYSPAVPKAPVRVGPVRDELTRLEIVEEHLSPRGKARLEELRRRKR